MQGLDDAEDLVFEPPGFDPFSSAFSAAVDENDLPPDDENPFDAAGDFADFPPVEADAAASTGRRERPKGMPRQDTLSGNNPFRVASTEADDSFLELETAGRSLSAEVALTAAAVAAAVGGADSSDSFDPLSTIYPESDNSGDEAGGPAVTVQISSQGAHPAASTEPIPQIQGPPPSSSSKNRFNPFNIAGQAAAQATAQAAVAPAPAFSAFSGGLDVWGDADAEGAASVGAEDVAFEVDWEMPAPEDSEEAAAAARAHLRSPTPPMPPFEPFHPPYIGDSWKLLLRMPETKKKLSKQISKFTTDRYWKDVLVRLVWEQDRPTLKLYNLEDLENPYRCIRMEPFFQLSHDKQQHYDKYGKLHIFKVNLLTYKELVGVRTEKWSLKTIQNMIAKPKTTDVLDHMPIRQEILKFGSTNQYDIRSLMWQVEDYMMKMTVSRDRNKAPTDYMKEECCGYVQDEYEAAVDKLGRIQRQKSRTRVFFTAFVAGMPYVELGLNDKWRYGSEVVKRQDIIPIVHDDWIDMYEAEFHAVVDMEKHARSHMICFYPLDACRFELMRFRVALRENQELPVQVKCVFSINPDRVDIRCDVMVPGYFSSHTRCHEIPAEDIEIRIPIPEDWIYFFRQEGKFKYNSVHSALRKPGRIKGIERITQMAQGFFPPSIMEANVGVAKYEHLYRAIVWRIAKLPEKHHGAYKSHLFTCKLQLGPHDTVPTWENLAPSAHVEFRMPGSTVSGCTVRSIGIESSGTAPGKFVQYAARYSYSWGICYEQGERKKPPVTSILDDPAPTHSPTSTPTPTPQPQRPAAAPVFTDLEIPDAMSPASPTSAGGAGSSGGGRSAFDPIASAFGFITSAASPPPRPPPPPPQQSQPLSIFQSALPGALSELLGLQMGGGGPQLQQEAAAAAETEAAAASDCEASDQQNSGYPQQYSE